jgi:hypothetical protein
VLHEEDGRIRLARRGREPVDAADDCFAAIRGGRPAEEHLLYVDDDDGNTGHASLAIRW